MHPRSGAISFLAAPCIYLCNCQIVLSLLLHICVGEKACNAEAVEAPHRRQVVLALDGMLLHSLLIARRVIYVTAKDGDKQAAGFRRPVPNLMFLAP